MPCPDFLTISHIFRDKRKSQEIRVLKTIQNLMKHSDMILCPDCAINPPDLTLGTKCTLCDDRGMIGLEVFANRFRVNYELTEEKFKLKKALV